MYSQTSLSVVILQVWVGKIVKYYIHLIIKNHFMKRTVHGFLCVVIVIIAHPALSQNNSVVGTWRLTAADKILSDGTQVADYGADPHGIAVFTADGHYAVEIFRSDRMKFASDDRAKGTPEEYKNAVLSNSCHFGTYVVDNSKGTITFNIERGSYPNWDQTTQVRSFTVKNDTLSWRVPPRADGSIPVSFFKRIQ
jgi:hypothetical protein